MKEAVASVGLSAVLYRTVLRCIRRAGQLETYPGNKLFLRHLTAPYQMNTLSSAILRLRRSLPKIYPMSHIVCSASALAYRFPSRFP
jgi:hypothetical protein